MEISNEIGEFTLRILIAFFAGALIGLERERTRIKSKSKYDLPGLRSFGLTSIVGALVSFLATYPSGLNGGLIIEMGTIGFIIILVFYIYHRMIVSNLSGITTYLTLVIAYFLGLLSGLGMLVEAVSGSILATFVLAIKYPSRKLIKELSYNEFIAILEVGTMSLIIGPIIYSLNLKFIGIDLFKVYIFFLVVLWISLISYFSVKVFGALGLESSAVLGSLVNSEATIASVTSLLSRIDNNLNKLRFLRILTIIIISTLHIRSAVLALIAVYMFLSTKAALELMAPIIVATTPAIILLLISTSRKIDIEGLERITVESPLNWSGAIKTAIAYSILTLTVYIVSNTYTQVLPIIAFLGGLVNATATIFSLTAYASSLPVSLVAGNLLVTIASATLNKIFYLSNDMYKSGLWKTVLAISVLMSLPFFAISIIELLL